MRFIVLVLVLVGCGSALCPPQGGIHVNPPADASVDVDLRLLP